MGVQKFTYGLLPWLTVTRPFVSSILKASLIVIADTPYSLHSSFWLGISVPCRYCLSSIAFSSLLTTILTFDSLAETDVEIPGWGLRADDDKLFIPPFASLEKFLEGSTPPRSVFHRFWKYRRGREE